MLYNSNFSSNPMSIGGKPLNLNDVANPCGMQARYMFNDEFHFSFINGTEVSLMNKDIIWYESESGHFRNLKVNSTDVQILN